MLTHWIQPIEESSVLKEYLTSDRLGKNLATLSKTPESGKFREVALIGADAKWTKLVRRHLYQFSHRMSDAQIYDLGDLRKLDPEFVIGPLLELISAGICPVVVGAQGGLIKSLSQVFSHLREPFRPVVVHESVPEYLKTIHHPTLVIGVQQHLMSPQIPLHIQTMHLSQVRNAIGEAETQIRDSNSIIFDLTSMTMVDMPAQKSHSSSGFCTEEACMLMRFASLHQDTKAVLICGHDPMSLELDRSANTAAQLIWYFLEGFSQCITEDPLRSTNITSYSIHLDTYDTTFKFYKSERTGRWWVQMLSGTQEPIFPCTYKDYQSATTGIVSDRLISCASASLEASQQTL